MRKDEKSNSPTTKTPIKAVSSKRGLVLTLLVLAQFMVIVDFMIVQVALPSIGKEFGISINVLQWTVTAYGLTLAGFLMLSGRLGDIYGHKKLFIIGVLLFSLASLMGGLAPSDTGFNPCKSYSRTWCGYGLCSRIINSSYSFFGRKRKKSRT